MKWSSPLVTGSIGTREAAVQFTPSAEVEKTMSLAEQLARKRQSSHATYTLPAPSISAVGSGLVRSPPATPLKRVLLTATPLAHDAPPSVDRNASILLLRLSNGTMTVPLGWTSGWPPRPLSFPAVGIGVLQVWPPSVERLTNTVGTAVFGSSGMELISQVPCLASKATERSLTRSNGLAAPALKVMPGRKPGAPQVAPPSSERAKPMSVAPPLKKRPTWNAPTT